MASQCNELKAAKGLERLIDVFDFKPGMFAYFMTRQNIRAQKVFFNCIVQCVWVWGNRYDNGDWENDEVMDLYAQAKRIQDVLERLGYGADV